MAAPTWQNDRQLKRSSSNRWPTDHNSDAGSADGISDAVYHSVEALGADSVMTSASSGDSGEDLEFSGDLDFSEDLDLTQGSGIRTGSAAPFTALALDFPSD